MTRSSGRPNVKTHALIAQNNPMPRRVIKIALGRCVRGAFASSAAVDTTSKPQNPRTPTTVADQKPTKPCVALNGLKGTRVIPPTSPAFVKSMVPDKASTTQLSRNIKRIVVFTDASAPCKESKATGIEEMTTPKDRAATCDSGA